jgi:hypothetical protein
MSRDGSAPVGTVDGASLEVSMLSDAQDSSCGPSRVFDPGQWAPPAGLLARPPADWSGA